MAGRAVRYQGGSIVSFIIIAVVTMVVLGAGLYALRQRSEQARLGVTAGRDASVELPGTWNEEGEAKKEVADDTSDGRTNSEAGAKSTQGRSDAPAKGDSASGSDGSDGSPAKRSDNANTVPASPAVTMLPETGPSQMIVLPVVAVIVYLAMAYVASIRRLAGLR